MANDPVIDFAQDLFGTDAGLPDVTIRPGVPDWLAGATAETTEVIEGEITIRTEGDMLADSPAPQEDSRNPDDLAFYLPFHFYRDSWGIYVRASGVWMLATEFNDAPRIDDLRFSYDALLWHERFHFLAEYAASRLEVVTSESRYAEYFRVKEAALLEEAAANAQAFKSVRPRSSRRLRALENWMSNQPPGYRDFKQYLPPRFEEALRAAAWQMFRAPSKNRKLRSIPGMNALRHGCHPAEFLFAGIDWILSPTFIILDASVPWLKITKPFPKQFGLQLYVFPNDHKPPHIHIDCPPGREFTRYLWPELKPYPGDARLRKSDEKGLYRYVAIHGNAIATKIAAVPWQ